MNGALRLLLGVDERLFLRIRRTEGILLTKAMRTGTRLGDTSTWFLQVLLIAALGGKPMGWKLGVAALLTTGVTQILKRTCRRPRPSSGIKGFVALAGDPDSFSFPSGHTAVAVTAATSLAHVPGVGPLEVGLAAWVAVSRVYLGAHYPLDVSVGALIGLSCGLLALGVC